MDKYQCGHADYCSIALLIHRLHQRKHHDISEVILLSEESDDTIDSHPKSCLDRHPIFHRFDELHISTCGFDIS